MKPNKFSSEHIKNEFITLTSETSYSEGRFETKIQAKVDKYNQSFKQQEEELVYFKVKQH